MLAEGEASQANRLANEGNFYEAGLRYERAAQMNPFESRYSDRRDDALFRVAEYESSKGEVASQPP